MRKIPDKLKGRKLETKKPAGKERGLDKSKKGEADKIKGAVKGKVDGVMQKIETRAVRADVERQKGAAKDRQKEDPKKPPRERPAKPEVPAADTLDAETAKGPVQKVTGKPVDEPIATAPETEAAQKQKLELIARTVYTLEQLTEFESLGISLDVAGSYVFVTAENADGTPRNWRRWKSKQVKLFLDSGISAERVKFYMSKINICYDNSIIEWEKHPELTIEIIIQRPERFCADCVEFYADFFSKHPDFTWADVLKYPLEFGPYDVANLITVEIRPEDSLKYVELFSTGKAGTDLFTTEQLQELQTGGVPPEVRVAYRKYGIKWDDKAILYFAEHRAKPGLVALYPKEFSPGDRVYCIENFVNDADIARYPQWTEKYEPKETVRRVCFFVKHNADSALSRQVFEKYREKFSRHSNFNASRWAWNNLQQLIEEKVPLEHALKYIEKFFIPAEYVILFIKRGVSPETVNDYLSKDVGAIRYSDNINYNFICECAAAGMKADDAKPYWEDGSEKPTDVVVLWRGKTGSGTAKPYQRLFYENKYREETCEHNPSGAEIVRYVNEDVSPEVAALLRKADFTPEELSEAVTKVQRQKTRSKVLKIFAVVAATALVALGIKYKGACGRNNTSEKETEDRGQPAAAGPAEAGREKPEQQEIRIPTSLCRFDFIPPKRVDLSCFTNYSVPIPIRDLVIDGEDKVGERTVMKAHATGVEYTDGVTYDCKNADFFMPASNPNVGQLLDPVYDRMVCEPQPVRQ